MEAINPRTQNWIDGLEDAQRERALRVIEMPPEMGVAYSNVETMSLRSDVESLRAVLPILVGDAVREAMPKPARGDLLVLGASAFFTVVMSIFGGPKVNP